MRRIELNMSALRARGAARALAGDTAARLFDSSAAPTISRRDLLKATGAAFTVLSPGVGALGAAGPALAAAHMTHEGAWERYCAAFA